MTNYTYEEKQIAIKILKDLMSHEVECTRKLFGAFNSHLHAVPSNLIHEKIKQLKTVTFGDIKNQVGTKFKVPTLHKNRVFMVCNFVSDPNKKVILNTASKAIIENVTDFFKDEHLVEVINETETTNKGGG